ncbi:MAG: hypothetical protein NC038_06115 [Paludibacter sp.]|nr:hypothetical protein [Bacteroidales bacterium]MCM1069466.1 hypothetical protein [Prevotella sp.]MCM1354122.1 hypothetical protein [Bacteroides sp.]MCM1443021.1 hypothetical protein [Muribaculum sp.]MCM1482197.1 hypothetical protein [Paludibacter sp.]
MTPFLWIMLALGLAGVGTSVASNIVSNKTNKELQQDANDTNIALARESNVAQAAESEKAYNRSKATNQVNLMRAAGMSKAGALSALQGGGVYTPAPVNTAQVQAAQVSDEGFQNASEILSSIGKDFGNTGQMREQFANAEKLQKLQMEADKQNLITQIDDARQARREAREQESKEKALDRALTLETQLNQFDHETQLQIMDYLFKRKLAITQGNIEMALEKFRHGTAVDENGNIIAADTAAGIKKTNAETGLVKSQTVTQNNLNKHDQERFNAEMQKYADEHKLSQVELDTAKEMYNRLVDPVSRKNWKDSLTLEETRLANSFIEEQVREYELLVKRHIGWKKSKYTKLSYESDGLDAFFEWCDDANNVLDHIPLIGPILQFLANIAK